MEVSPVMSSMPSNAIQTLPPVDSDVIPQSLPLPSWQRSPDLTIHRRTASHHGDALRMLGHAAEYLVSSRAFSIEQPKTMADREAAQIVVGLSRQVFEEYARINSQRHPVTDWIMKRAVRIYGAA
jgi:hypothetical protein